MSVEDYGTSFTVWISSTYINEWVQRWPYCTLDERRLVASFDTNGLLDLQIRHETGGKPIKLSNFDMAEVSACIADAISEHNLLNKDHPCYFVAVGQFITTP